MKEIYMSYEAEFETDFKNELDCREYWSRINSNDDSRRVASLEKYFLELELQDYILFHLSVTYKPFEDRIYTAKDVNVFFQNMWFKKVLRNYLFKTEYSFQQSKALQPYCYAFVDEHDHDVIMSRPAQKNTPAVFVHPVRLHHHAIIASHPSTLPAIQALCEPNSMRRFSQKCMTSDLKVCDAQRVFYANKMFTKYPEFLSFGPRH